MATFHASVARSSNAPPRTGTARAARRRGSAGAVLLEALVVIVSLTLFFVALVYVDRVYMGELRAMRVARAAALAYATQGCSGAVDPGSLVPDDLGMTVAEQTAASGDALVPRPTDGKARDALAEAQGKLQHVSSGLPPATTFRASGTVASPTGAGPGARFGAPVRSTSYVMCNDANEEGDVTKIVSAAFRFLQ